MKQGRLLRLWNRRHQSHDGVDDGLLKVKAPFLAKKVGQKADQNPVLQRVLEAKLADGRHDDDLELVCNFVHKRRDLLHQAVHRGLAARLEERGDRKRRNRPVLVGDERLHVVVAFHHRRGPRRRHARQGAHRRQAQRRLGRRKEELQHRNRRPDVAIIKRQRAERLGGFVDHGLAAVPQRQLQELVRRAAGSGSRGAGALGGEDLSNVADEEASRHR
mmetsp:Transcript_17527/g.59197  ORF Transcript_17527/g.59197 Transcript_17527/m.59197 type:complete len:218 (+) Transcript_17527:1638-2291(+)